MDNQLCISSNEDWEYGCNKCLICDRKFKHTRCWVKEKDCDLFYLRDTICHASCLKLVKDIKKKKEEIVDLEWKLFEKKMFI